METQTNCCLFISQEADCRKNNTEFEQQHFFNLKSFLESLLSIYTLYKHIIVAHGHLTQPMCPNLKQYIANCLCLPFLCNKILLSTAKQMHLGNVLYIFQYSSPVTVNVRTEIFASITFILGKQKKSMTSSRRREAVGKAR